MYGIARMGSATGSVAAHGAVTVTATANGTKIPTTNLKHRKAISIRNWSGVNKVYIGNYGVTTSTGFPLNPYESLPLDCSMKLQWYGICETGKTVEVRYLEINVE